MDVTIRQRTTPNFRQELVIIGAIGDSLLGRVELGEGAHRVDVEAVDATVIRLDDLGHEIVDAREVAERLGMKNARSVLDLRIHRLGFPPPVGRVGRTLVWSWSQVATWADESAIAAPERPVAAAPR
jgi:predicted DNA-binding transcriptional regulator AlpA